MECQRVTLSKGLAGAWCVCCAWTRVCMYATCAGYLCAHCIYVCALYSHTGHVYRVYIVHTHVICIHGYCMYMHHMDLSSICIHIYPTYVCTLYIDYVYCRYICIHMGSVHVIHYAYTFSTVSVLYTVCTYTVHTVCTIWIYAYALYRHMYVLYVYICMDTV